MGTDKYSNSAMMGIKSMGMGAVANAIWKVGILAHLNWEKNHSVT